MNELEPARSTGSLADDGPVLEGRLQERDEAGVVHLREVVPRLEEHAEGRERVREPPLAVDNVPCRPLGGLPPPRGPLFPPGGGHRPSPGAQLEAGLEASVALLREACHEGALLVSVSHPPEEVDHG